MNVKEMFANAEGADLATRYDEFQKAIVDAPNTLKGDVVARSENGGHVLEKAVPAAQRMAGMLADPTISKALTPDQIAGLTTALEQAQVQKDLTLTSPLSTGYVQFDLEAPAKLLYPKQTPLRNRIPRQKGVGTARRYKKIDGISGSAGGPAVLRPGITDSTTTTFGSLSLVRGQKISYTGSEATVPYLQFGLSDSVPWSAQFAGEGFWDARAQSRASLLYASMLSEERLLLGGRGTASGFSGALAQPTGVTAAVRAATTGETAITGGTTNYYLKVTARSVFGESVLSALVTVAVSAGVLDVTIPDVAGAVGYNVYIATGAADPGDASRWLVSNYAHGNGSGIVTVQGALPTSGTAASTVTADTSASALDYDGILTVVSGSSSGYTANLNAAFSTTTPGTEFQTAFASLWDGHLADPDEILMSGQDRKQLSNLLTTASSSNYRVIYDAGADGKQIGALATAIQNQVTGKMVDMTVHPYMPQGNTAIISWTLPFPDSNVASTWEATNVQDYMATEWPVIQNTYDASTYWFGTFFCYAPAWQGSVRGIKQA